MSACCHVAGHQKMPAWVRRAREILAWALPGAILVIMPKCPACLAAYVTFLTGFGLSLSTATYLRGGLFVLCTASLVFLIVNRLNRIRAVSRCFKKETDQCNIK
jgi:hypothetical protein